MLGQQDNINYSTQAFYQKAVTYNGNIYYSKLPQGNLVVGNLNRLESISDLSLALRLKPYLTTDSAPQTDYITVKEIRSEDGTIVMKLQNNFVKIESQNQATSIKEEKKEYKRKHLRQQIKKVERLQKEYEYKIQELEQLQEINSIKHECFPESN